MHVHAGRLFTFNGNVTEHLRLFHFCKASLNVPAAFHRLTAKSPASHFSAEVSGHSTK